MLNFNATVLYDRLYLTTSVARVAAEVIINKPGAPLASFELIFVTCFDHVGRTMLYSQNRELMWGIKKNRENEKQKL